MEKEGGVLQWAQTHNCEFEISKFALIGFSQRQEPRPFQPRKRQPIARSAIKIQDILIKPVQTTKFLRVTLHQSLSWAEQTSAAIAKGADWAIQCRHIAKPTQGIPLHLARQLYLAVCIPKILYAADIWATPPNRANR